MVCICSKIHATLEMGHSFNSEITTGADGNQSLYVDFALDMDNADSVTLVKKFENDPTYA